MTVQRRGGDDVTEPVKAAARLARRRRGSPEALPHDGEEGARGGPIGRAHAGGHRCGRRVEARQRLLSCRAAGGARQAGNGDDCGGGKGSGRGMSGVEGCGAGSESDDSWVGAAPRGNRRTLLVSASCGWRPLLAVKPAGAGDSRWTLRDREGKAVVQPGNAMPNSRRLRPPTVASRLL